MADEISLEVVCPICGTKKNTTVPSYIFENKAFGTLKIQIHKGIICDHQFVIFVDKKGKIRGYEKIDIQLSTAPKAVGQAEKKASLDFIVKLMGDFASVNIFHAFLLDIPVVIIRKTRNEDWENQVNTMSKELFPDLFESKTPIEFVDRSEYKEKKIKNLLLIDEEGYILSAPWEINKFDFEEDLLKKALGAEDFKAQLIIFQRAIKLLISKVEYTIELLEQTDTLYEEEIKENFIKKFMIKKVSDYDVDLVKEILKFRYLVDISKIKIRSFDKLKESLW